MIRSSRARGAGSARNSQSSRRPVAGSGEVTNTSRREIRPRREVTCSRRKTKRRSNNGPAISAYVTPVLRGTDAARVSERTRARRIRPRRGGNDQLGDAISVRTYARCRERWSSGVLTATGVASRVRRWGMPGERGHCAPELCIEDWWHSVARPVGMSGSCPTVSVHLGPPDVIAGGGGCGRRVERGGRRSWTRMVSSTRERYQVSGFRCQKRMSLDRLCQGSHYVATSNGAREPSEVHRCETAEERGDPDRTFCERAARALRDHRQWPASRDFGPTPNVYAGMPNSRRGRAHAIERC